MDILFIINPLSGGRKKNRIVRLIQKRLDYSLYAPGFAWTKAPGEAEVLARQSNADIVVAVGGDGTVHEVACGLLGSGKILGIIPCGSGNGLALHLRIGTRIRRAIRVLNAAKVESMDYATVNDQPFFVTAGVGFDALVAWNFANSGKRGLLSYIKQTLLTWEHYSPEYYTITVDGKLFNQKAFIVSVGNANQWGNHAMITPLASVKDGKIDIALVETAPVWMIPILVAKLFDGRAHKSKYVSYFQGTDITVSRERPGCAHIDGEPLEMNERLEFRVHPSALKVIVP